MKTERVRQPDIRDRLFNPTLAIKRNSHGKLPAIHLAGKINGNYHFSTLRGAEKINI